MDEQQVRLLVRQAIARHLGSPAQGCVPTEVGAALTPQPADFVVAAPRADGQPSTRLAAGANPAPARHDGHPSAARFVILRPIEETECIIEPAVTCNHCGYCQCYGH